MSLFLLELVTVSNLIVNICPIFNSYWSKLYKRIMARMDEYSMSEGLCHFKFLIALSSLMVTVSHSCQEDNHSLLFIDH